jgi:hypothetical protein
MINLSVFTHTTKGVYRYLSTRIPGPVAPSYVRTGSTRRRKPVQTGEQ